ncbi:sulfite exporter TauE/SafE family protein [Echinicola shivajiensis]|uniref:sulfite exporter TauE/SafE family protein n=1 Tax=Echinicola shivajiensis TaxID=1035916 RepID=UPI001BFC7585|nr:sulfite exporter TauE/SafE family protein [Echinicola shivajiensis]
MIWTAFLLGFLGSFHCLGMCGPIALAVSSSDKQKAVMKKVWYNLGRTGTYAILGLLAGTIGLGLELAGFQQWVSIGLGVLIILFAFMYKKSERALAKGGAYQFVAKVKSALGYWLKKGGSKAFFMTGLVNGFLPCGMVYIAVLGSMAMAGPVEGAIYMASFGMGTIPLLMALMLSGNLFSANWRIRLFRFMPYFAIFIGLLFVIRGLGLGIHFLSPALEVFDPSSGIPASMTICK